MSLRLVCLQSLDVNPPAIAKGPSFGFLDADQHRPFRAPDFRVLMRDLHLVEYTEIVKPALRLEHVTLAERLTDPHRKLAVDHPGMGMLITHNNDALHLFRHPGLNVKLYVDLMVE